MRESLLPAAAADLSEVQAPPSEGHFTVLDPATEQPIASVADHDAHYALEQISRATSAGAAWAATTPRHRADIMHNVYDLLLENRDRLASVITREMGKTLKEAAGEVQYSADYVRWYAEELVPWRHLSGQSARRIDHPH
jgi:succinate-semialdehyde dehydrogenase/glutarate-semialdehyde dehydrogenase